MIVGVRLIIFVRNRAKVEEMQKRDICRWRVQLFQRVYQQLWCGACATEIHQIAVLYQVDSLSDNVGTSTSDADAPLRDIGSAAFGIRYPRNVTPKKSPRLPIGLDML